MQKCFFKFVKKLFKLLFASLRADIIKYKKLSQINIKI